MKTLNERQKKAFECAYDKIYDLNSCCGYEFNNFLEKLEQEIKQFGYEFYLKQSSQKYKMRIKQ